MAVENKKGATMKNNESFVIPLISADLPFVNGNPEVLRNIIGQTEARKKLSFFIESHSPKTPFPTMLFTGSQGLGKTYMAQKIADSLGRELVEINCGTIINIDRFVEDILLGRILGDKPKTILLDECHNLPPDVVTNLLTVLNPNIDNANNLSYKNYYFAYDFSKINTILATTDAHRVFRPLLNRCVEIYFSLYSQEDLYLILQHYLPDINIVCDLEDLADACRGRARDAFLLSQNIRRYCVMTNSNTFDNNGWNKVKEIFGIHPRGLYGHEIKLLKILEKSSPISAANLAIRLGVNTNNVEGELEIRMRELGFIESGTRGRSLTEDGKKYLDILA